MGTILIIILTIALLQSEVQSKVDGNWTDWSTWSACAITCGNTTQTRSRACTNPPAADNGTDCEGTSDDYQPCLREPCPVDGNWTDWSSWSACSVTRGSATKTRIRTCISPPPAHKGTECEGASEDYKSCVHKPCRGWGPWSEWSSCSSTSGVGIQHRNRSWYSWPSFTSIDDLCDGDYTDVQICMPSAFDGGWTQWSSWSTCSVTCGIGLNQRTRSCTNPRPSTFGHHCEGPNIDVAICNKQHCPTSVRLRDGLLEIYVNGQWGTVCDDEFDSNDAKVACRMLGFDNTQTARLRSDVVRGNVSMPIWLDDLRCNGNEDSLLECSHNGVGTHNCNHSKDVGLVC
ncbi:coadhesin-like [Dreissena polymorpha]|uniref:coadhesin-like n=1 Tax=Dreissena polymorpha TaxID=45954 RepID=UPI002263E03A|nr:coadhesin-like [Dreissena polymorpha]